MAELDSFVPEREHEAAPGPRAGVLLLIVILLALGAGCRRETTLGDAAGTPRAPDAIERQYRRGPLTVRVSASSAEMTIADRLELQLEAELPENYTLELPEFGETLDEFVVVDRTTTPPELVAGGRLRTVRSCVLEPFLPGEYRIPSLEFRFAPATDPEHVQALSTEPLTIIVHSLLPDASAEPTIDDIRGPAALPRGPLNRTVIGVAALAAAAVLAAALLWRRRRRRRAAVVPTLPAHELAYRELAALQAARLIENGEIERFYVWVSAILRRYIENRFGLHAPERTTEEFLAELGTLVREGGPPHLEPQHQQQLDRFLNHCDLVKFAAYQPETVESKSTFELCRTFVADTAETGTNGTDGDGSPGVRQPAATGRR